MMMRVFTTFILGGGIIGGWLIPATLMPAIGSPSALAIGYTFAVWVGVDAALIEKKQRGASK